MEVINKKVKVLKIQGNTLKILWVGQEKVNDKKYLYIRNLAYFNIYGPQEYV